MTTYMDQITVCEHTWFTDFIYPVEAGTGLRDLIIDENNVSAVELVIAKQDGTTISTGSSSPAPSEGTDAIFLHHVGLTEFWCGKVGGKDGRDAKEAHLQRIKTTQPLLPPDSVVCPCWVDTVAGGVKYPAPPADWVIPKSAIVSIVVLIRHNIVGKPNPLSFPISPTSDTVFLNHNGAETYIKPWHTRGGYPDKGLQAEEDSKNRILNSPNRIP